MSAWNRNRLTMKLEIEYPTVSGCVTWGARLGAPCATDMNRAVEVRDLTGVCATSGRGIRIRPIGPLRHLKTVVAQARQARSNCGWRVDQIEA
jgi:hypothetical protein